MMHEKAISTQRFFWQPCPSDLWQVRQCQDHQQGYPITPAVGHI